MEGQDDNENSQYPVLDLNRVPTKYKSQMLPLLTHYKTPGVQEVNIEFVSVVVKGINVLEDLGIYCRITLKKVFVNWINLVQVRFKNPHVTMVLTFQLS